MHLRSILDPNLFILQWNHKFNTFKINYNPNEEQLKSLRRFLAIIHDAEQHEHHAAVGRLGVIRPLLSAPSKDENVK